MKNEKSFVFFVAGGQDKHGKCSPWEQLKVTVTLFICELGSRLVGGWTFIFPSDQLSVQQRHRGHSAGISSANMSTFVHCLPSREMLRFPGRLRSSSATSLIFFQLFQWKTGNIPGTDASWKTSHLISNILSPPPFCLSIRSERKYNIEFLSNSSLCAAWLTHGRG